MIRFQEEVCPIKFHAGEWTFEVTGEKGKYQLITYPEGNMFLLTYPNGKSDEGKIDDLFKIKNKLRSYEHGLIQWVYQVVHWYQDEQYRHKYKFEKKEIVIDNRRYFFEFCPRNHDVQLTLPGFAAVVKRAVMSKTFPEVYSMEGGGISMLLNDIVISAYKQDGDDDVFPEDKSESKVSTPLVFNSPKEYIVGNNRYLIQYDKDTDLLFFLSETRIIKTYLGALDVVLPELRHMHNGELARQIYEFADSLKMGSVESKV